MNSIDNNDSTGRLQPSIASGSVLKSMRVVRFAQFLPKHDRNALYAVACENQTAFQPPGGPGVDIGGSLYLSLESNGPDRPGVARVREASQFLSRRILGLLPALFVDLDVEPFAVSQIPLTFVNGLDGHCGVPHADSIDGRFKISLLYYFHRLPKAFRGGDLEFYGSNAMSPSGHSDEALARINHEDNLLIAFPSQTFHGITDVRCDSKDFADGRFAAIVFLGPH